MSNAIISDCGKYRYYLQRRIKFPITQGDDRIVFVMLNPSTADAEKDDPTIRRCMAFAKREGASLLQVVNLFAYRATDPRELVKFAGDPVGPENEGHWFAACTFPKTKVIAGWGAFDGIRAQVQADYFHQLTKKWGVQLYCLGRTKDGFPRHPLYLPALAPLEKWP